MKHKHHIIPKHMGGTDEPSNLIELSVEDHAEAHKKMWEEYGNWQDYLAWRGLSGRMEKEEIIRYKISQTHRGKKLSDKHIEILVAKGKKLTGNSNPMYGKTFVMSGESKKKISESMKGKNVGKEPWNKGKTGIWNEESIKKISRKIKEKHQNGAYDYEKMGESRRGFKQSDFQKSRVRETLESAWLVTTPEGEEINIVNLRQFCKENELDQGNMVKVSQGKLKQYKKWKCIKIT